MSMVAFTGSERDLTFLRGEKCLRTGTLHAVALTNSSEDPTAWLKRNVDCEMDVIYKITTHSLMGTVPRGFFTLSITVIVIAATENNSHCHSSNDGSSSGALNTLGDALPPTPVASSLTLWHTRTQLGVCYALWN